MEENVEDEYESVGSFIVSEVLSQSVRIVKAEAQGPGVSSKSDSYSEDDYFSCSEDFPVPIIEEKITYKRI